MFRVRSRVVFAAMAFSSVVCFAQTGALQFPTNQPPTPIPESEVMGSLAVGNILSLFQVGYYDGYFGTFLPYWEYQVQAAQNDDTYTGYIAGSSPTYPWSSTVGTPIIPVILTTNETNYYGPFSWTWDPTSADVGCLGGSNTAYNLFWTSPLFTPTNFTINGQFIGNTQYVDAIQRSQFWNYPGFAGIYGRRLTLSPSLYPPLVISVAAGSNAAGWYIPSPVQCGGAAPFANATNGGSTFGGINVNYLDPLLQQYISTHGIGPTQFPVFLLYKTMIFNGDATQSANCCIGGYHNAAVVGGNYQTYAIADFEANTFFNTFIEDVSGASHELNEWANDPFVLDYTNLTPPWGNIGQVTGCQNNFEVADPLTGKYMPAMNSDGFTYHLQEIGFFNWFFGGTTNYGVGAPNVSYPNGYYSSNGTFHGYSKLCPPGGSN